MVCSLLKVDFFTVEHKISNIQNLMLVATNEEKQFDRKDLLRMAQENSINYLEDDFTEEGHFYEGKIKIDDVPFLTDQFAPVEKLINPVTSQPYEKEGLEYSSKDDITYSQSYGVTIGLLLVVVLVWGIEFRRTWKAA